MKFKPIFSVIVPIFNIETYLKKCIESILDQSFSNFELILIDDGSTDGSSIICDKYALKDSRVKVIHKENNGLVSARKKGIENALGEYAICVDGDDWIDKSYLEKMYNIIQKYNPDIICCGYFRALPNKLLSCPLSYASGLYSRKKIENEIFPILIENKNGIYFSPSIWAKTYRISLYRTQQLNVDNSITIGEDHACTKPCIFYAKSMYLMKECLYYYRINPESMTNNHKAFPWDGPMKIGKHLENQIDIYQFDFQEQIYRNVVHNLFNVVISQFNKKQNYLLCKKEILDYLRCDYYVKIIKNVNFKKLTKGYFASILLKNKLILLLYLINIIKNNKIKAYIQRKIKNERE